jgi:hypothetical protein
MPWITEVHNSTQKVYLEMTCKLVHSSLSLYSYLAFHYYVTILKYNDLVGYTN